MREKRLSLVAVIGLIFFSALPLIGETIVLVHSNDTHGLFKPYLLKEDSRERLVGGMEAVSHYLNQIRAEEKNVLVIETGDILTGTLAAELEYKGAQGGAMVEFLNKLGYDLWCFGNHDFDRGKQNALKLARLTKFPTVMANIIDKDSGKLFASKPYHVFKMSGIKVGIIAVMEENFLLEVQKSMIEGLDVVPAAIALNSYLPELKKKADLIVVISHSRFKEALQIAKAVSGIDVVLAASDDGRFEKVNGVLVKSTYGYQKTLGYLKLEVQRGRIKDYEEKLIWLWADKDLKPASEISALVKEVEEPIASEYAKVIGEAKTEMTRRPYSANQNDTTESALGNWITDVMRWKTNAQIAFQNTGGIRADIMAGRVTKAQIFDVSPFHNTLVVFKLTGQQIKDVLEFDVERGWDRLQVSGLRYRYYAKGAKPYKNRIAEAEANGEVLVKNGTVLYPEKVYTVVSNNYLVGQAEGKYFGFKVSDSRDTSLPLHLCLMDWLEKFKVLDYRIEGRIIEIVE